MALGRMANVLVPFFGRRLQQHEVAVDRQVDSTVQAALIGALVALGGVVTATVIQQAHANAERKRTRAGLLELVLGSKTLQVFLGC